jgi:mannose/fructose/N-acetylgalactosamine-specific phosphotransferase system component IIC
MFLKAILIGLVGALGILESRILGETKFGQPLVTGLLVGLILGDVKTGIILGAQLQLIWMGVTGVGVAATLDVQTGGILGTAFAILTGKGVSVALTLAIPIAILGQFLGTLTRSANQPLMHKADEYAKAGDMKGMSRMHWTGAFFYFLNGFVPCFLAIYAGSSAVQAIINCIPAFITKGLNAASGIFPALGFAMLLQLTLNKKLVPFFIAGFALSVYTKLNTTAIAIFGTVLALIIYEIKSSIANREEDVL